jgi:hypothetical protein
MERKLIVTAVALLCLIIAIPTISALATVGAKPKILVNITVPLKSVAGEGTSEQRGDNIMFKDACWTATPTGVTLKIYKWLPNTSPPPEYVPAPSSGEEPWPLSNKYTGGTCLAEAHGTRDAYTFSGKWHMQFKVTFNINGVESGFEFRHDCTAVGLVHSATWDGQGFGAFDGLKVSGISIADLTKAPATKLMWGEVTGGWDNIPAANVLPLS